MNPNTVDLRRRSLLAGSAAAPLLGLGLASCGLDGDGDGPGEMGEPDLKAELPRAEPGPAEGAGHIVVPFTARMLGAIGRGDVNAVCSPLSAQVVLTMAGLGAAGDTRAQMEAVLGGTMDELAAASNTLSSVLAVVGDEEREADEDDAPEPAVASLVNGVWAQEGMTVQEPYLEDLAEHFGSGVYEVDYIDDGAREDARERINGWVADATNDLIEELISADFLSADTRMVLVNALHLKAAWRQPLSSAPGPFTLGDGSEVETEMLTGSTQGWYEDDVCRATSLGTYGGDLSLALVQPVADVPAVLDAWADAVADGAEGAGGGLSAVLDGVQNSDPVELILPAFDIEWGGSLKEILEGLGMELAFGAADFSGITAEEELHISDVVQKAVITVDSEGMEAAAATAAGFAASAPVEPNELVLDSPFLFVAYETSTLAPLVLGWIGDPTQTR
ncbi:serpin family protein [Brachybacterium muris]|uniref:serpin family protein n=1 Tax=Brachybacterium muris TaxID=219301 RepID=UPI00223C25E0|nr:serpin family protein [Brachybacterium muris]MCT2177917.1 serpin family protein [Brachybacterium muris]